MVYISVIIFIHITNHSLSHVLWVAFMYCIYTFFRLVNQLYISTSSSCAASLCIPTNSRLARHSLLYLININRSVTYFHWKIIALAGIWTGDLRGTNPRCYQLSHTCLDETFRLSIFLSVKILMISFIGFCQNN